VSLALTAGVAVLTSLLAALPLRSADRRFERPTLRRILPIFLVYLLVSALWPPFQPVGAWHGTLALTDRLQDETLGGLLPLLEYLAAFTWLGYLSAEWRGRSELSLGRDLPRLLLIAAASALGLEGLAGFQIDRGASFARAVVVVAAALLGGSLYHLQRTQVRALLGRPPGQRPD